MAQNGNSTRAQASAATRRDLVPLIDHCVAILVLAALLWLSGVALAAERGTPEQRLACPPDASTCCDEFVPDRDCGNLHPRELGPDR